MREITFSGDDSELAQVMRTLEDELDATACVGKERMQLQIAVEEICVNILRHAFPGGASAATFQVETESDTHRIVIRFIDDGAPFNPLTHEDPDTALTADEREVGGLGILLAKKNVDSMDYEYRDGKNILTMTKIYAGRDSALGEREK